MSDIPAAELAALVELVMTEVDRHGLLLVTDRELPSVTTLVAGEPVRGSWWGHEKGHEIYAVLNSLPDDVRYVKLLNRKETIVHRRIWPALVAVGAAGAPWQTRRLRDDATALLRLVDEQDLVRTDRVDADALGADARKVGRVATDLEQRLLVHAWQEHTGSGYHARYLTGWDSFADRNDVGEVPPVDVATSLLEEAAHSMCGDDWKAALPW